MQEILQEKYRNFTTEELVVSYQSTNNEDILKEVMRRNYGLLRMWVRDYSNIPYHDEADLLEEGYVACWKSVCNYDPERGVTFSTFLKATAQQHYNRIYNEATRQKRYTGQEPTSWEELEEINKEKSIEFELLSDLEVREFIALLDGKVQEIAINLLNGYSKSDIAKMLHITPATTTYHCKRLESLAREYFSVGGSRRLIQAI